MTAPISVVWCAPAKAAVPIVTASGHDLSVRLVGPRNLTGADADVIVLDSRCFETVAALLNAGATLGAPIVVCCVPEEAEEVLAHLPEGDDVCLIGAPTPLVLHRVRQLARRHRAATDDLTGLSTRKVLVAELKRAVADSAEGHPVSLLLLDVDWFKMINDTHGHDEGDRVLTELSRRIRANSPEEAICARIGGEEIAVLTQCGPADSKELAANLLKVVRGERFGEIGITVSIGTGTVTDPNAPVALFAQADEALYAAKARGRDQVVHYADMERAAIGDNIDVALESFENRTRVIAESVAEVITRRGRRLFQELKTQADMDGLTGLFSRRYFDRRLPFEFATAIEEGHPLTIALLDLDFFGEVNKKYGWPTGDHVLTEVSNRVRQSLRSSDWVARYGGEEICVVMYRTTLQQSAKVLERLRTAVAATLFRATTGEPVTITVSIGAAERSDAALDLESLIERVSSRLLEAKRDGRNRLAL